VSDRVSTLGSRDRGVLRGREGNGIKSSVVELANGSTDCNVLGKRWCRNDVHVITCDIDDGVIWSDNGECGRSGVVGIPLASLAPRVRAGANMGRLRAHGSIGDLAAVSNEAVGTSAVELNAYGDWNSECGRSTPHLNTPHTHKVVLLENLGCGGGHEKTVEKISKRHREGAGLVTLEAHSLAMGVLGFDRRGVC